MIHMHNKICSYQLLLDTILSFWMIISVDLMNLMIGIDRVGGSVSRSSSSNTPMGGIPLVVADQAALGNLQQETVRAGGGWHPGIKGLKAHKNR